MRATSGHRPWILVVAVVALVALFAYRYEFAPPDRPRSDQSGSVASSQKTSPAADTTPDLAAQSTTEDVPGTASPIGTRLYPDPAQRGPSPPPAAVGSPYPAPDSESSAAEAEPLITASPEMAEPVATLTPSATSRPIIVATLTPSPTATPQPSPTRVPPTPTPPAPAGAYPAQPTFAPVTQSTEGKRSNIGPYLLANPEAGQPTHNLLRAGNMRAYIAINPAHWGSRDSLPNMEGYGRNWIPADQELGMIWQGAEGGRRYFDKFKDTYRDTRDDIHAWMSTWAFIYGDDAFARQWVAFQREWLRLMHQDGFRAGVGGMRTHEFYGGEITWLAPAIADSDYLFLSEADAPTLMYGRGDSTFLYRALVSELRQALGEDGVPELVLDVAVDGKVLDDLNRSGADWKRGYIHYGTTKESYMSDVRAYDRETLRDPYVRHVFWFATNYNSSENESFDVDTYMLSVANSWYVE